MCVAYFWSTRPTRKLATVQAETNIVISPDTFVDYYKFLRDLC